MEAELGDELVALDPNAGECFGFNSVATSVWRNLEQPKRFEQLRDALLDLGAGRAAGQALLLADSLFNTLQSAPDLGAQLMSDRATRSLYRAALRLGTGAPREPTATRAGTLTIHWTQFLLLPGLAYKLSELKRQAGRFLAAV
jgi:hypothetical protein